MRRMGSIPMKTALDKTRAKPGRPSFGQRIARNSPQGSLNTGSVPGQRDDKTFGGKLPYLAGGRANQGNEGPGQGANISQVEGSKSGRETIPRMVDTGKVGNSGTASRRKGVGNNDTEDD